MRLTDIEHDMLRLLNEVKRIGYRNGLLEGASRLRLIASVVPHTVSKTRLIDMASREAEVLEQKAKDNL